MPSVTFDLETVTPLFLGGAEQEKAELRPPAFRGALRYWFRAIAGARYWNNIEQLNKLESEIFGSTEQGSKIIIRLQKFPDDLDEGIIKFQLYKNPGLSYLWFSTQMQQRQAIGVHDSIPFSLTFSTRPNPKESEQQQRALELAINCFWLAINLGGFGSRERRGAGSLRVVRVKYKKIDPKKFPKFVIKFRPSAISQYLRKETRKVVKNIESLLPEIENKEPVPSTPNLEIYSPKTAAIYLITDKDNPYQSWENALEYIGQQYKDYRQNLERRERAIFGLPLKKFDMQSRHPSPLRIKVIRSVNDYYCLLIKMQTAFPLDSKIDNPENPDYSYLDDFFTYIDSEKIKKVG